MDILAHRCVQCYVIETGAHLFYFFLLLCDLEAI